MELHSTDGVFQFVPNSGLWNKRIVNYTRLRTRMVDLKFGISYADDVAAARHALLACMVSDPRIEADPAPFVFVDELADSAVVMRLRCWTPTPDFWSVRRALMEYGKGARERAGLSIPTRSAMCTSAAICPMKRPRPDGRGPVVQIAAPGLFARLQRAGHPSGILRGGPRAHRLEHKQRQRHH